MLDVYRLLGKELRSPIARRVFGLVKAIPTAKTLQGVPALQLRVLYLDRGATSPTTATWHDATIVLNRAMTWSARRLLLPSPARWTG
ncbi:hypothetical protein [Nonomuraea angiospora]|uniref:hypothetical protein n=1 Tax=Nonomuraea angiospora TaxID=46172 RepID=UPI0029B82982|nr:hypothetical protein [Nonomuraea angiospora]MDX3111117.1 hypothetical protein [Nonomuraea angiospora]